MHEAQSDGLTLLTLLLSGISERIPTGRSLMQGIMWSSSMSEIGREVQTIMAISSCYTEVASSILSWSVLRIKVAMRGAII